MKLPSVIMKTCLAIMALTFSISSHAAIATYDLYFAFDSSGSVDSNERALERDLIRNMVLSLPTNTATLQIRYGLVNYSGTAVTALTLSPHQALFINTLNNLPALSGFSNPASAITSVTSDFNQSPIASPSDLRHLFLFADGNVTGTNQFGMPNTLTSADGQKLIDAGFTSTVIGFGDMVGDCLNTNSLYVKTYSVITNDIRCFVGDTGKFLNDISNLVVDPGPDLPPTPQDPPPTGVPAPATYLLFGLGLLGMRLMRRQCV